jgi:hypothetical protein
LASSAAADGLHVEQDQHLLKLGLDLEKAVQAGGITWSEIDQAVIVTAARMKVVPSPWRLPMWC